jgi:hypothetical protein
VRKPDGKRPHRRPRRRWEANTKKDIQEIGLYVEWNNLAQERNKWPAAVNTVMNLRVPHKTGCNVRKM